MILFTSGKEKSSYYFTEVIATTTPMQLRAHSETAFCSNSNCYFFFFLLDSKWMARKFSKQKPVNPFIKCD